jgi:hypothetical protein
LSADGAGVDNRLASALPAPESDGEFAFIGHGLIGGPGRQGRGLLGPGPLRGWTLTRLLGGRFLRAGGCGPRQEQADKD